MRLRPPSRSQRRLPLGLASCGRLLVLLLPLGVLLLGHVRSEGDAANMFLLGAGVQALLLLIMALRHQAWQQAISTSVTMFYLMGAGFVWLGERDHSSWFSHFAQFLLLGVPLAIFAIGTLTDSGALATRRAILLAQRLATRQDWPADLADCRHLPEVKALREALALDASPALALLQNANPQARMAALAALEFRQEWLPGQPELVLRFALQAREPMLRAAAVAALANLDERTLIERVAEFLCDSDRQVRKAAVEALLWDSERRWAWIRPTIRKALGDAGQLSDGPLLAEGPPLPPEAVNDLSAWTTEKGVLGVRAAQTLAAYYNRTLSIKPTPELIQSLKHELGQVHAPPALRVELAQLLRNHDLLDRSLQEALLDSANPASLRLLGAESLLAKESSAPAVVALRDIARMPNREMALAVAQLVQKHLGVDLGLALGEPLPALHTRLAADVTRRLMKWAAEQDAAAHTEDKAVSKDTPHMARGESPDKEKDKGTGSGVFGIGTGTRQ